VTELTIKQMVENKEKFQVSVNGPPGCEWAMWHLPDDIFDHVKEQIEISKIEQNPYKTKLAGHISKSYHLTDPENKLLRHINFVARQMLHLPQQISNYCQTLVGSISTKSNLDDLWVNYQKKYEFNPIHNHSGILSFVIWVKIPYDFEKEQALAFGKDVKGVTRTACFEFVWPVSGNAPLNTAVLSISKKEEGVICVFPSHLHHLVYPFYTSDDTRISVSGNIRLEIIPE